MVAVEERNEVCICKLFTCVGPTLDSCVNLGLNNYGPQFSAVREISSRIAEFGFLPRNRSAKFTSEFVFSRGIYRGIFRFFIPTTFSQKMTSKQLCYKIVYDDFLFDGDV